MSRNRRDHWNRDGSLKARYRNLEAARSHAWARGMDVYRCGWCCGYHVGHPRPRLLPRRPEEMRIELGERAMGCLWTENYGNRRIVAVVQRGRAVLRRRALEDGPG